MAASRNHSRQPVLAAGDDDSPVTVLRQLEEERGKMFTEAEYPTMRAAGLHELVPGARLRPFTLFTFAVVAAGLVAMLVIGLAVATRKSVGDYALAIVSGIALVAVGYFFGAVSAVSGRMPFALSMPAWPNWKSFGSQCSFLPKNTTASRRTSSLSASVRVSDAAVLRRRAVQPKSGGGD
jgi:hypothetical protein